MRASSQVPVPWAFVALGLVLGAMAVLLTLAGCGDDEFVETQWTKPWAADDEVRVWHDEWERRAARWTSFPDPPGHGPVEGARYWVSRQAYEMEVRRRGDAVTLEIHGVDEQEFGGGWSAFGEGRIEGPERGFAGAVLTITWSCLGIRFRTASDGVARVTFSDDGVVLAAEYMAHEAPEIWLKSYGRKVDGPRPARGVLRGQIPFSRALERLPGDALYDVDVLVTDELGTPIVGALAGLKGVAASRVRTDRDGLARIRFYGREAPFAQPIDAGKAGYYNGEYVALTGDALPGLRAGGMADEPVRVTLLRADLSDHPDYAWNHPARDHDPDDAMACATCHGWHYDEWLSSRHARSGDNGLVQWSRDEMRAFAPEAPDDCAGCHTPGRAAQEPDAPLRRGGMLAANHCDFCHKIARVPDLRQSGVFGALELARPDPDSEARPGGIKQVFGTTPDATFGYMGAIYNPLFASSHLCAACHQGGGLWRQGRPPKIDTFDEWRRWAVAQGGDEKDVESCQDCHMPGASTIEVEGGIVDQIAWDALHRSPAQVHGHRFQGREPALARDALEVTLDKTRDSETGQWVASVAITNTGAGHKIPTGTWTKHVLVGVWARSGSDWLAPVGGDHLPVISHGGPSPSHRAGDWSGAGGVALGMLNEHGEVQSEFWSDDFFDARLAPGETRRMEVIFAADAEPDVELRVVHRRGPLDRHGAAAFRLRPYDAPPEVEWLRMTR